MPRHRSILWIAAMLIVWMPASAEALPGDGPQRSMTPAELRSHLLHGRAGLGAGSIIPRDGTRLDERLRYASSFPSFQHSSINGSWREETVPTPAPFDAQAEDRWLAFDKVQHLTFSFLWTLGTQYVTVNKGRISERHALPISITSSAVVGVSKEVYDLHVGPSRYFSKKDLAADALGILLAAGLILL